MLTFKDVGNLGRFGNQLFQITATIGTATKHGYDYAFPKWSYQQYFKNPLPFGEIWPEGNFYENGFHYTPISCLDNTNLSGFFQSEKYFKHSEELIRHYFEFQPELVEKMWTKYNDLLMQKTCAIHVRRGDYVTNPNHLALSYGYYLRAMDHFKDVKFLLFSDDIPFCKTMFEGVEFIEGNSDIEDFVLMTLCDHHIIANSTFSWWGAYLSKSEGKKIIAPRTWFGRGLKHHSTKDLYPEGWKIV